MTWATRSHRMAAKIVLLAAISFPKTPELPKPPDPVPISLYVWNASERVEAIAVAVDDSRIFQESVQPGRGIPREHVVELLPGRHAVVSQAGSSESRAEILVARDGNRWLVVAWWGQDWEVGLRQQPPWNTTGS